MSTDYIVLWQQSLYLSRMKNQGGHSVCWMSTSRKNGREWRTHIPGNGFCLRPGCCVEMEMNFRESRNIFEPQTSLVHLWRVKNLSYAVSADWDLKHGPFSLVFKGSIPHTRKKSISTTHTKKRSISMLTVEPSDLRPTSENQANFDHQHKNQDND